MGKNYVLKTKTLHAELTPTLFIIYANDCIEAADFLKYKKEFSPVPYYLYCRSIELSLKAFLFHNGIALEKLKCYGHNLHALLKVTKNDDFNILLSVTQLEEIELQKASSLYDNPSKAFEYSRVEDAVHAYKDFPELKTIERLAKKMLRIKNLI